MERTKRKKSNFFYVSALAAEASKKIEFVDERVNKLRSSPVVAGSAQLRPHVDFLVARIAQCKTKLTGMIAERASKTPLAPPPVLLGSEEEVVVVDMLSPLGPRAVEVPGPPKLQKPEKSKSHVIERPQPEEEEFGAKKISGSQIVSGGARIVTDLPIRKPVSAMDVLDSSTGSISPRKSPRELRGTEQMGNTPLLKLSSSPQTRSVAAVPISTAGRNQQQQAVSSPGRNQAGAGWDATTPIRRPSEPRFDVDLGLGSPSPQLTAGTPQQPQTQPQTQPAPPPIPDRKSVVLDFDKVMGRVRGDSLVLAGDEPPAEGDQTNWKAEYDKMAQKFEAAKGLIVKMQEKARRIELQASQVPTLLKKVSQLEGKVKLKEKKKTKLFSSLTFLSTKVSSLEMVKVHYEEKVPQLNTRIVELENELLVMKNSISNSAVDQAVSVGERVWVSYNHLWHEGEVLEKNADGSFSIKLDAVLDPKVISFSL